MPPPHDPAEEAAALAGISQPAAVNEPLVPRSGVPSHWTPINVGGGRDPSITLCKLNYDTYWRNPDRLPMFKDLVAASGCTGRNVKSERLSVLKQAMEADPDGTLQPTGFVFHETRCGSTLVADMLASQAHHLVFSESTPPAVVAGRGEGHEDVLRDVMLLMCRSAYHTRCFFKFQSINTPRIRTFLRAFPEVPWAFVFREPVQVMMSHMKGGASGAVCLRSKRSPTEAHNRILGVKNARSSSNEDFCAAHLAYLTESALKAVDSPLGQHGKLLHYADLPNIMAGPLLREHFRAPLSEDGVTRMMAVSKMYSKGRKGTSKAGVFSSDNKKKEDAANSRVRSAAEKHLWPYYQRCLDSPALLKQ